MSFSKKVYKVVQQIPKGKVATYGLVATLIDAPRSARQVGWVLSSLRPDSQIPWWRVTNSKGFISIKNPHISKDVQKDLLQNEGIKVSENYTLNFDKHFWRPK